MQNATITTIANGNNGVNISFSGTANVSGGMITSGEYLTIGAAMEEYNGTPYADFPTAGAGNAVFTASGALMNAFMGFVVGTSGATATVTATGSVIGTRDDFYSPELYL